MEWNTDLIESMELEHVMSQDAQNLARHATNPEKHANTNSTRNDS